MSKSIQPEAAELTAYVANLPEIYRGLLVGFRHASPDRKYKEPILEATLRNYVKFIDSETVGATDEQIDEAIRQLESNNFVVRQFIAPDALDLFKSSPFSRPSSKCLIAPTDLGELILAKLAGSATAKPVVPPLPVPAWINSK